MDWTVPLLGVSTICMALMNLYQRVIISRLEKELEDSDRTLKGIQKHYQRLLRDKT